MAPEPRLRATRDTDPDRGWAPRVAFGPFVLDRREGTLRRRGTEIALPARALRLLEALVDSAGRTLSKDRLIDFAWRGAHVSDTSLTEAMSRLRRALGDRAGAPRYVRTVHGRGYRFIAPVRTAPRPAAAGSPRRADGLLRAAIAASVVLLAGLWVGSSPTAPGQPSGSYSTGPSERALDRVFTPFRELVGLARTAPPEPIPPRYRFGELPTTGAPPRTYAIPALPINDLSVDRSRGRLAFSIAEGRRSDVWILEPERGEMRRVVTGGYSSDPVWRPNGRQVALARSRARDFDLVLTDVDRDRASRVLLEAPLNQFPESWSADGRSLVYAEEHPETGYDLWLLRQRDDRSWAPEPLVRTANHEAFGAISPEGRYVAFTSTSGARRPDVLVIDLEGDREPLRVSPDGGGYPFWSSAGDRLHYVRGDALVTVPTERLDRGVDAAGLTSTAVEGLYLAGAVTSGDRIVVATLDRAASALR